MPAYFIVRAVVHDPVAYQAYLRRSLGVIAKFGGRHIARGGKTHIFEGPDEKVRVVIAKFTDFANGEACYRSPDYQRMIGFRKDSATFEFVLVDGA